MPRGQNILYENSMETPFDSMLSPRSFRVFLPIWHENYIDYFTWKFHGVFHAEPHLVPIKFCPRGVKIPWSFSHGIPWNFHEKFYVLSLWCINRDPNFTGWYQNTYD